MRPENQREAKAEAKRRLEGDRRTNDLCIRCGVASSGRSYCGVHRQQINERLFVQRARRGQAGLCRLCGRPSPDGFKTCPTCKQKEESRGWTGRRQAWVGRIAEERTAYVKATVPGRDRRQNGHFARGLDWALTLWRDGHPPPDVDTAHNLQIGRTP